VAKAANFSPGHDHKLPTGTFQGFRNDNTFPYEPTGTFDRGTAIKAMNFRKELRARPRRALYMRQDGKTRWIF